MWRRHVWIKGVGIGHVDKPRQYCWKGSPQYYGQTLQKFTYQIILITLRKLLFETKIKIESISGHCTL